MQQLRELDGVLLVVEVVRRRRDAAEKLDEVGHRQVELGRLERRRRNRLGAAGQRAHELREEVLERDHRTLASVHLDVDARVAEQRVDPPHRRWRGPGWRQNH